MPVRLCLESRCGSEATWRGRCPIHRTERNRETRSKNTSVYNSKRWKILRRHKLNACPICERCHKQLATDVHHKQAIQAGGNPWLLSNLEALCHPCHSMETRREQATR